MTSSASTQTAGVSYRRLAQLALAAAAAAAAVNTVLFFVFRPLGAWPQEVVVRGGQPMSLPPILIFSFIGVVGAAVVLALLARFTKKPERNFFIVAAVVFIGFFFTPFTIPGAPSLMIVALELAHVPPAIAAVWALPKALEEPA